MAIISIIMAIENESDRDFMVHLYTDYYQIMKRESLVIVKNEVIAEDIVQTSCIKLIEHMDTIRNLEKYVLISYILTTVKRTSYNYLKNKYAKDRLYTSDIDTKELHNIEDRRQKIDEDVVNKITVEELIHALSEIPQKYLDALRFKYILDMSDKEISESLQISLSTVRVYLKRAKELAYEVSQGSR